MALGHSSRPKNAGENMKRSAEAGECRSPTPGSQSSANQKT